MHTLQQNNVRLGIAGKDARLTLWCTCRWEVSRGARSKRPNAYACGGRTTTPGARKRTRMTAMTTTSMTKTSIGLRQVRLLP